MDARMTKSKTTKPSTAKSSAKKKNKPVENGTVHVCASMFQNFHFCGGYENGIIRRPFFLSGGGEG